MPTPGPQLEPAGRLIPCLEGVGPSQTSPQEPVTSLGPMSGLLVGRCGEGVKAQRQGARGSWGAA